MSNEKTGYNFIFDNQTVDISDIGAKVKVESDKNVPASFQLDEQGYGSTNENFRFLYTNTSDPWKQKTGFNQFYSSSFSPTPLTKYDIATNSSCPNFNKVIGFYGDGTNPDSNTVKQVFKKNKTYRLQVKVWNDGWNDGFLISIGDDATYGVNPSNVGQWHLKSQTGALPTALIVGIQAAGGNGGNSASGQGGAGGGSGACAYFVLDWEKARQKIQSNDRDSVLFDFYITPITGWKDIAYSNDTTYNTCNNSCVAINLKNDSNGSSSNEDIKSKIIIGCGQDAYFGKTAGAAGVVKNYDLSKGTEYSDEELAKYGIHRLTMHTSGDVVTNAGKGGNGGTSASKGSNSNWYWLTTTNQSIQGGYSNLVKNQYCSMPTHYGGNPGDQSGGGGASNFANGGNGGSSSAGADGTLGSGGGGGSYRFTNSYSGGSGGLPYIFFCSNIDLSVYSLNLTGTVTHNSAYKTASDGTVIGYLQEDGNTNNSVYIYPTTTSLSYPVNCDESNTLFYYEQGGYMLSKKMSEVELKTTYTATSGDRIGSRWGYDIVFTSK